MKKIGFFVFAAAVLVASQIAAYAAEGAACCKTNFTPGNKHHSADTK